MSQNVLRIVEWTFEGNCKVDLMEETKTGIFGYAIVLELGKMVGRRLQRIS